ncbi:MAG: hypothetical protein BGN97_03520 [Microbacterium sp. 69-10]|uniref:hypothetical protein n=1 Tax=Microbacterium sp. 69-10 TaxID=1895783 RepID=UPI00095EAE4F|nr:hypothetical protein [Microbacterium sp. 69-10]OJU41789.1 MAG: hypothetical protein BGN97_03520 [Microbacterium sp. 69-10]
MKHLIRLLLILTGIYVTLAAVSLLHVFPFEAIAWTGLILILAWAWVDTKGVHSADRTREVVG